MYLIFIGSLRIPLNLPGGGSVRSPQSQTELDGKVKKASREQGEALPGLVLGLPTYHIVRNFKRLTIGCRSPRSTSLQDNYRSTLWSSQIYS